MWPKFWWGPSNRKYFPHTHTASSYNSAHTKRKESKMNTMAELLYARSICCWASENKETDATLDAG